MIKEHMKTLTRRFGGRWGSPAPPHDRSRSETMSRKRIRIRIFAAMMIMLTLAPALIFGPQIATNIASASRPGNNVLARAVDIELGKVTRAKYEQNVSSGPMYAALQALGVLDQRADAVQAKGQGSGPAMTPASGTEGCPNRYVGGGTNGSPNTRVNQDCSLRRQAEEVVVVNPTDRMNLIAGQNDSRIGFNKCGYDWSLDGGKTWGDQVPPFYQFVLADGHTADACSDPTASFDSTGNAYVGGVLFDINSDASAAVVAKSNAGIDGQFYHTPNSALSFQTYRDTPLGVVASNNDPNIFNDKELLVADSNPASPKANNVYMTWTRFNGDTGAGVGANSPIYFSQSTNGGATWSAGVEISGANPAICTVFSGETNPNACDQDQGSQPVVGPDGTVYVAFGNGNTPTTGLNQHLVVSCPPGANCSSSASWTMPSKISDDYGTQPVGPDPVTGCPGGRSCLPPNGYRLDDFVEGSLSADSSGKLYFAWADYRNGASPCTPLAPAASVTPPCNNDVFYAYSTDGGASWSSTRNITSGANFGLTAQWMPWSAVQPSGDNLWVAFYDRSYGNCEFDGCNDITLAKINNPTSGSPTTTYTRLTTSSMPNLVPANNPLEAGFLGDYMWVTVDSAGKPYVAWADTRGMNGSVEEDIYFAKQP
jgi:hypothetical protein